MPQTNQTLRIIPPSQNFFFIGFDGELPSLDYSETSLFVRRDDLLVLGISVYPPGSTGFVAIDFTPQHFVEDSVGSWSVSGQITGPLLVAAPSANHGRVAYRRLTQCGLE